MGLLLVFAPKDGLIQSRFDVIGAAILALALGALAWALSQIGPSETRAAADAPAQPGTVLTIVAGLGIVGFAVYALWERGSEHPMTPPRLVENRAFLGLNVATLMIYSGISIVFFLLPFDLVDRRALSSVMSSVDQTDEGIASGINNAASRIAQLAGAALAAGAASFESGFGVGLAVAAATSIGGAFTAAITPTPAAAKASGSGGA